MSETLLLVDTAALAFRGYYAFINRPLTRSDGMNTSALFGLSNTLVGVLEKVKPTHVACAQDASAKTFRHEMYEKYKANRTECPPELSVQLKMVGDLCEALGCKPVIAPGFEADDIIGSLATAGRKAGFEVVILSGDKDFMQLLDDKTSMMLPQKGNDYESLKVEGVVEKIGVKPEQVIDYLSLLGDTSDNVPGAPGVGKVTAAKLLQEHGDLNSIIEAAPEMKKKGLGSKIIEHREQIELSKRLVTIKTDMDEMPSMEELAFNGFDLGKLVPKLEELEFPRLLNRLKAKSQNLSTDSQKPAEEIKYQYQTLEFSESWLGEELKKSDLPWTVAYSSCPKSGQIDGIALSWNKDNAGYIKIENHDALVITLKSLQTLWKHGFAMHDAKEFVKLLKSEQLEYRLCYDSYLQVSVLRQGKNDHSIIDSVRNIFGYEVAAPASKPRKKAEEVDAEQNLKHACEHALWVWRLSEYQSKELEEFGLTNVYQSLEMPLFPVIVDMEFKGFSLDPEILNEFSEKAEKELDDLSNEILTLAGEDFNINSPQQLGNILFEKMKLQDELGIKKLKKTKTGYSTDAAVLEKISVHPIGKALKRYRFLSKLKSTYYDALPLEVNEKTKRIHTHFLQNGTATGRLSSQKPNLQNIPMKTPEGSQIRRAFIPSSSDNVIISADYSQIELRVLAHFCQDEMMRDAFERGDDIHAATAAKVYGQTIDSISREQRSSAKAVNFGLLYGMGPRNLSESTGMDFKAARKFIVDYFASFPKIQMFMKELVDSARECGYASTLGGRKRPLPDLNNSNGMLRNAAENMALNTPIQGSAADIIKCAMIHIHEQIKKQSLPLDMLLQVHDELVFECPKSEAEQLRDWVVNQMEDPSVLSFDFSIGLKVEANIGNNWLEAH